LLSESSIRECPDQHPPSHQNGTVLLHSAQTGAQKLHKHQQLFFFESGVVLGFELSFNNNFEVLENLDVSW
jgi:hypothetical protein